MEESQLCFYVFYRLFDSSEDKMMDMGSILKVEYV